MKITLLILFNSLEEFQLYLDFCNNRSFSVMLVPGRGCPTDQILDGCKSGSGGKKLWT